MNPVLGYLWVFWYEPIFLTQPKIFNSIEVWIKRRPVQNLNPTPLKP
uniref:Uncharacterized protein n=1 Tax=Lepeophtheirus salmonis TaxID=72036 RepID=A0A0K2U3Z1_LEPSM